ncbi:MAG: MBL fold metallo-hydrolase, partial [Treponema sp.]|nr:MBL fold metallo-hydrolase [Treponema sp.]
MKSVSAKLYFEGAAGSVTGSCNRLEYTIGDEQYQLLVDCGLAQETEEGKVSLPKWNFAPEKISCVLLTHAHVDHCGAIPLLYKNGFNGKVYATDATRDLAEIMMQDISRTTQLYEDDDIEKIKWYSVDSIEDNKEMGRYFFILDNVSFVRACFIRSSHVLGASSIYVQWFKNVLDEDELNEQKSKDFRNVNTILFSGDIGRTFDEINPESTFLKPNHFPFKSHENQTEFYVL